MLLLLLSLLNAVVIEVDTIRWGTDANATTAPWNVLLNVIDSFSRTICHGAIVDRSWILTTNQCALELADPRGLRVRNPQNIRVIAGELNLKIISGYEQYRTVDMIFIHPDTYYYDLTQGLYSDVAMLHLEFPLEFNEYVTAIEIGDSAPKEGTETLVTGFGLTQITKYPNKLKYVKMMVTKPYNCERQYPDVLDDTMYCLGDNEMRYKASRDDEGGAIVQYKGGSGTPKDKDDTPYAVGLVSWCNDQTEIRRWYNVVAKVTEFKSWVNKIINQDKRPVLEATDVAQSYSWNNNMEPYQNLYIRLRCNTASCRIHVRKLHVNFHGDFATKLYLFDGWSLYNYVDMEVKAYEDFPNTALSKWPLYRFNGRTYIRIYADSGYASESDKMYLILTLGKELVDVSITFDYAILDTSRCEDPDRQCDEVNDCFNGNLTDEMDCTYAAKEKGVPLKPFAAGCYPSDHKCNIHSGGGEYCIREENVCDGYKDCQQGLEEFDLTGAECVARALPISSLSSLILFLSVLLTLAVQN